MKRQVSGGLSSVAFQHVSDWRRSGLNQSAYCRQYGVSISSFSTWKSKAEQRRPAVSLNETGGNFISLSSSSTAELEFAGGIKVRLDSHSADLKLLRLLKEAYGV